MELTYTQCGDYLIPNLVLADTQEYHIGKYGRMRRAYLKEYRPALYVISRIAGEGKDRRLEPGDYYLSDAEQADLQTLDESGLPVVLLLNAGGPVELTGLLDGMQHLDAILQLSQLGQQGGQAVADVLLGSLENGFLEAPPHHEGADTYYQFCTAFPVGTALAQSWDPDLLAQVSRAVSREMDEFHVDLWLAPGMNIQRNPLCGRNFEYYSEDPLLTGTLAAAITAGVQESGRHGVTLKHFACNNQEDNRMAVDARVSERALREIYLRGFEIAVKAAAPAAVMSAYNCINGVHAANSRDLCTVVLRQEWGFAGLVMSDWNTTVPQDGSTPWRCAWAGNDVIMPGNPHDDADIRAALADGRLPETAIRQSAARLIALASALRGG